MFCVTDTILCKITEPLLILVQDVTYSTEYFSYIHIIALLHMVQKQQQSSSSKLNKDHKNLAGLSDMGQEAERRATTIVKCYELQFYHASA